MATLIMPDGNDEMMALKLDDRQAIYVLMHRLALHVQETGVIAMILVNEFWEGTIEDLMKGVRPSESPDRKEALQVQVATAEGQLRTYSAQFCRDNEGNIGFGETRIYDSAPNDHWGYLEPVHQVWKRWNTKRQGV